MCKEERFLSWLGTKAVSSRSAEISKRHLLCSCASAGNHPPCVSLAFRERTSTVMTNELAEPNQGRSVTRRRFLGLSLASGAALVAGKSDVILGADTST